MKHFLKLCIALLAAVSAQPQLINVTAVVRHPSGNLYANGVHNVSVEIPSNATHQSVFSGTTHLNSIRFADQFAGADWCAKITAALGDLPATGGTINSLGLEGAQNCASTIRVNKPLILLVGATTVTSTAAGPIIDQQNPSLTILGLGPKLSTLQAGVNGQPGIQSNNSTTKDYELILSKVAINDTLARASRASGNGINIVPGDIPAHGTYLSVEDIEVNGFFDGIHFERPVASSLRNVRCFNQANDNFAIVGPGTSLGFLNTYGFGSKRHNYSLIGAVYYTTFTGTAADVAGNFSGTFNSHGYYFGKDAANFSPHSITMNSPGCEQPTGSCLYLDGARYITVIEPFFFPFGGVGTPAANGITTAASFQQVYSLVIQGGEITGSTVPTSFTGYGLNFPAGTVGNTVLISGGSNITGQTGTGIYDPDLVIGDLTGAVRNLRVEKAGVVSSTPGIDFWGTLSTGSVVRYNAGRIYSTFDGATKGTARTTLASPTGSGAFTDVLSVKGGQVGIGITTPRQSLDVSGVTRSTAFMVAGASTPATGFVALGTITVGSLPAAAVGNAGQIIKVSDSTTIATEGQTCAGGGAMTALAFSNGTTWKCF